jgi:hypothetical protein
MVTVSLASILMNQKPVSLGGPIKGYVAPPIVDMDNSDEFAFNRLVVRDAWTTTAPLIDKSQSTIKNGGITPFRLVNNAGDFYSRTNYSCGGGCQSFQSRPGMRGLKGRFGGILSGCDNSNVQPGTCNVKYVYDSSVYTTYLKQKAVNKVYNDSTYGGANNGAQVAYRHSLRGF